MAAPSHRFAAPLAALVFLAPSVGCTLVKPAVCALTTPALVLDGPVVWSSRGDGRAALCGLAVIAGVGAAGGLVTGFLSDCYYIAGMTDEPCRNLHVAFATNLSR